MVYMITEHWWPSSESEKVGQTWLDAMKQFPEDRSISKPVVQAATWPSDQKMHSITVYSVQPGKVKEAMDLAFKRLLVFSNKIEGWQYEINIAFDSIEAMGVIGLKPPEV